MYSMLGGELNGGGGRSPKQHLISHKREKGGSLLMIKPKVRIPLASCGNLLVQLWHCMMHPQDSSCSVFKALRATPLLPCSSVEGTLPVALTMFTKPPAVFNIHKSTLHLYLKKQYRTKSNPYLHTEVCIQRKSTWRLFKNFKSQCSVTKHIIPLIKLTYYTWVVLPKDTRSSTPLKFNHGREICGATWNYTLHNPNDFHEGNQTHYWLREYANIQKLFNYLCYADHLRVQPQLSAGRVSQWLMKCWNKATVTENGL